VVKTEHDAVEKRRIEAQVVQNNFENRQEAPGWKF
jgi:hypothetical protein